MHSSAQIRHRSTVAKEVLAAASNRSQGGLRVFSLKSKSPNQLHALNLLVRKGLRAKRRARPGCAQVRIHQGVVEPAAALHLHGERPIQVRSSWCGRCVCGNWLMLALCLRLRCAVALLMSERLVLNPTDSIS